MLGYNRLPLDAIQKGHELLRPVPLVTLADDLAEGIFSAANSEVTPCLTFRQRLR